MLSAKVCDPDERISLSVPAPPSIVSEFAAVEVLTVKVSSCPLPVSVSADALPIKLKPPVPVALAKKIAQKNPFIKVKYFEDKIKSNRTVDLIKYIKKNNKNTDIYFIMGADSLINFHKWKNSDLISSICNILVFDRDRYKAKSLSSRSFKKYSKKSLKFIKFNKVNISSSKLRKI